MASLGSNDEQSWLEPKGSSDQDLPPPRKRIALIWTFVASLGLWAILIGGAYLIW